MNIRERFLATMAFERADRAVLWEWDYWGETLRNWSREGAPLRAGHEGVNIESTDKAEHWDPFSSMMFTNLPIEPDVRLTFTLDPGLRRVPLNSFICPLFEYRVLQDDGDIITAQDKRGHIRREKKGGVSISHNIKPLVANRDDWERVKVERLQLSLEDEELALKVPDVLRTGGYIPCCDHSVPPNVSWERFCYYRERLTELAEYGDGLH